MLFLEGTEVMMNESIADAVQGASLRVVAIQEEPSLLSILLEVLHTPGRRFPRSRYLRCSGLLYLLVHEYDLIDFHIPGDVLALHRCV